jgi:NitT/TauT family transport system ATP-binding protein
LKLTAAGHVFARASIDDRKRLFREHLLRFVPLAAHICRVLHERGEHEAPRLRFDLELQDHLTHREAERTLRAATAWGRYAELFSYDDKTKAFSVIALPKAAPKSTIEPVR